MSELPTARRGGHGADHRHLKRGYAVIRADRVTGQPSRPNLPSPVIGMARRVWPSL
jgi:hypothetical protein